jgi:hypothetical protein
MRKYLVGFVAGIALGAAIPAAAAVVVGDTGYLMGWSVTKDGEEICSMPFVWTATKEIDCD